MVARTVPRKVPSIARDVAHWRAESRGRADNVRVHGSIRTWPIAIGPERLAKSKAESLDGFYEDRESP
jgi:hypothetical protein